MLLNHHMTDRQTLLLAVFSFTGSLSQQGDKLQLMKPESNLMMCVNANKLVQVQTYKLHRAKHSLQTNADLERKTLTSLC